MANRMPQWLARAQQRAEAYAIARRRPRKGPRHPAGPGELGRPYHGRRGPRHLPRTDERRDGQRPRA
eukprot:5695360-Alexandrium_andersonii.AAC.1